MLFRSVFDSARNLIYRDYYFNGNRIGDQIFFRSKKIYKYVFSNFENRSLYEAYYDSSESVKKFGGEIINATLYDGSKDGIQKTGVFSYFIHPPKVNVVYTIGLIEDKTNQKKEIALIDNERVFIDTLMNEPLPGWFYYVAADYNDYRNNYNKVYITVLK